jgi:hypothetical protein
MSAVLLTEPEIQQVLEQVKTAFPNFTDWEYNNEKNGEYFGFSVWGEYVIDFEELAMPRQFFLTLDTDHEDKWQGCLTIGQHSYLWSSADVGDAHLVNTEPCKTLKEAFVFDVAVRGSVSEREGIAALKTKITELFQAFS